MISRLHFATLYNSIYRADGELLVNSIAAAGNVIPEP